MGIVSMKVDNSWIYHGSTYVNTTVYVYCDKCGSFNIQSYLNYRKWLSIYSCVALIVWVVYLVINPYVFFDYSRGSINWVGLVFIFGLTISIISIKKLWGDTSYKCRKCGSATTIKFNTRNYSPYDMSVVDVPDQLIARFNLGYWSDLMDLDEYLKPSLNSEGKNSKD
jgi:hypothetical protein